MSYKSDVSTPLYAAWKHVELTVIVIVAGSESDMIWCAREKACCLGVTVVSRINAMISPLRFGSSPRG
eukprot:3591019-Amphidinium_carterae.1